MSLEKLGPNQAYSGPEGESPVQDRDAVALLQDVLKELRIMNFHLSILTDNAGLKDV